MKYENSNGLTVALSEISFNIFNYNNLRLLLSLLLFAKQAILILIESFYLNAKIKIKSNQNHEPYHVQELLIVFHNFSYLLRLYPEIKYEAIMSIQKSHGAEDKVTDRKLSRKFQSGKSNWCS